MGQTIGRAPLPRDCLRFLNLPRSSVYELWEAFNDIAEGFGLTIDEFQEIVKMSLKEHLGVTEQILNAASETAFRLYDDDQNDLVDALEFLSSFAMLSGMTPEEKIRFIFAMYDFDESGVLTVDELILALRSTMSGLTKISRIDAPSEQELEKIAVQAFHAASADDSEGAENKTAADEEDEGCIGLDSFVKYCLDTPEIMSWIAFFDDLEEFDTDMAVVAMEEKQPSIQEQIHAALVTRTERYEGITNVDVGWETLKAIQDQGKLEDLKPRQPWQNTVAFTASGRAPEDPAKLPPQNVALEWIHGYNAHLGRQHLGYSAQGKAVYPAASTVVVLDIAGDAQSFFTDHTDSVVCVKLRHREDGSTLVASGQVGVTPCVKVWDCDSMQIRANIAGYHRRGVSHVDFSPNGELLLTVGMDPYHRVAVYEWTSERRVFSSRSTDQKVLDARFLTDDTFATCGVDHIFFWQFSGSVFQRFRGFFGRKAQPEPLWTVAAVGSTVVTGSESGFLKVWEGRNCVRDIKAHTGKITALYVVPGDEPALVSGCTQGKVQIWNSNLELGATFNVNALGAAVPGVVGLCWDVLSSKMLIGTMGNEIFEMNSNDGRSMHDGAVIRGHYSHGLHGMSIHPFKNDEVCTVGHDKSVRIWNFERRRMLKMAMLDTMAHCCAYSPDGILIAIGLGSGMENALEKKEGAFVIVSEEDLTILHEGRDSKQCIADIKFSPDGNTLAVASYDSSLYLYTVGEFASKAKCRGHNGQVLHLDFSADSQFMRSNSSAGELNFWDCDSGDAQPPKNMREVQWDTNDCPFTFGTQGLLGPYDDDTITRTVSLSHAQDVIAAGDNYGRVRVYLYPCVQTGANHLLLRAHSAEVSRTGFTMDDTRLITTGAVDCCLIQWSMFTPEAQDYTGMTTLESERALAADTKDGEAFYRRPEHEEANNNNLRAIFSMDADAEAEDTSHTIKPWQRTIVPPSRIPVEDLSEPGDDLVLEFVHNFRSDDTRSAVRYTVDGTVVFFIGTIAVIMDRDRKQRFYQNHTDEILAMDIHPTQHVIATAQAGEVPSVHVWDSQTLETIVELKGQHRRAITTLAFSPDGSRIATCGHDEYHAIAIYDWRHRTTRVFTETVDRRALALSFNREGTMLVQAGVNYIRFWELNGANVSYQDAFFGKRAKLQSFLCIGWLGSFPVIGTMDGNLYKFMGRQLDSMIQAHNSAIFSLSTTPEGICTGGEDGLVKIWTPSLECRLFIDMRQMKSVVPVVRAVDWDAEYGRIVIGTLAGEIYEVNAQDGSSIHTHPLLHGHAGNELHGMAPHPSLAQFATVGEDRILRIWDVYSHRCIKHSTLEMAARSVAFHPSGDRLAVGFGTSRKQSSSLSGGAKQFDGKWVIISNEDFRILHEARDSQKSITEIKFSPDGELLAMGSYDCKIYMYSVSAGYSLSTTISQHNSLIAHLDFSQDGMWLQSNCGAFELNFFEADTGMYLPAASRLRDTRWATQTATMGWGVQGIWPPQLDGTSVTSCDCNLFREREGIVVAAGDNFGRVRLFRYPSTSPFACFKQHRVHSADISKVRWVNGDSHLITVGASDKGVFQWRHERDEIGVGAKSAEEQEGGGGEGAGGERKAEEEDDGELLKDLAGVGLEEENLDVEIPAQMMAVASRPWVASMVEPSDPPPCIESEPLASLELHHVNGYQGERTRSAVRYNAAEELLSPTSNLVCVFNRKANAQRYYREHKTDVVVLCTSDNGRFAASAEATAQPRIHIWDALTCDNIAVLQPLHRKGIICINFSPDAMQMVSVGYDNDHSIGLWRSLSGEWNDGYLHAWCKGDVAPVTFCDFYGVEGFLLASGGKGHFKFWNVSGRSLNSVRPVLPEGEDEALATMLCGSALRDMFVSGSANGNIYVWDGRRLDRRVRAHELGVTALFSCPAGLVTGSHDGSVKLWSPTLAHLNTFFLQQAVIPPLKEIVRSIHGFLSSNKRSITKMLAATAGGEVYEIATVSGSMSLVQESHFDGELWGLATHPTDPDIFATVGDDMTVRVWSVHVKRMLRKAVLDCTARCIDFSPDGRFIVVGLGGLESGKRQKKDGAFLVLNAETLQPVFEGRDCRHWIRDVKFSPDGSVFAVGSMDHKIYLYSTDTFRLKATCDKHNSYIRFMDFSTDGSYLQSNSGDHDHLYFDATDGSFFAAQSQLKNMDWATWTCIYGWPVQGPWPSFAEATKSAAAEPTAMHRSFDRTMLAVGDNQGDVCVYNYPCTSKRAQPLRDRAHTSGISNLRFTCDSRFVISIGQGDRAISVWRVRRPEDVEARALMGLPEVDEDYEYMQAELAAEGGGGAPESKS